MIPLPLPTCVMFDEHDWTRHARFVGICDWGLGTKQATGTDREDEKEEMRKRRERKEYWPNVLGGRANNVNRG